MFYHKKNLVQVALAISIHIIVKPALFVGAGFVLEVIMYKSIRNYENINKALFPLENKFRIPQLESTQITCDNFIGFNEAKSSK